MNGDRWVVQYATGEWGVERRTRRTSDEFFRTIDEALASARAQARAAGGGDVVVQAPDGSVALHEVVDLPELASASV